MTTEKSLVKTTSKNQTISLYSIGSIFNDNNSRSKLNQATSLVQNQMNTHIESIIEDNTLFTCQNPNSILTAQKIQNNISVAPKKQNDTSTVSKKSEPLKEQPVKKSKSDKFIKFKFKPNLLMI